MGIYDDLIKKEEEEKKEGFFKKAGRFLLPKAFGIEEAILGKEPEKKEEKRETGRKTIYDDLLSEEVIQERATEDDRVPFPQEYEDFTNLQLAATEDLMKIEEKIRESTKELEALPKAKGLTGRKDLPKWAKDGYLLKAISTGGKEGADIKKKEEEIKNLQIAADAYRDLLREPAEDKNFFSEFAEAIKDKEKDKLIPFVGSINSYKEIKDVIKAVNKKEQGQEITSYEDSLIEKYKSRNLPIDRGIGYAVGSTIAELPTYAAEFAMTGGVYTAVKAGLTKLVKKKAPKILASKLPNLTFKVGSTIIAGGAQSLVNVPAIAEGTANYMIPQADLVSGENSKQLFGEIDKNGDSFDKALVKAIGVNAVEYITERAGVIVEKPLDFIKKATLAKFFASRGIKESSRAYNIVKGAIAWDGIIGEVFEEELAEVFQAPIEEREYYPITTPQGAERLLVETLSIGAFGGVGKISDVALRKLQTERKENDVKPIEIKEEAIESGKADEIFSKEPKTAKELERVIENLKTISTGEEKLPPRRIKPAEQSAQVIDRILSGEEALRMSDKGKELLKQQLQKIEKAQEESKKKTTLKQNIDTIVETILSKQEEEITPEEQEIVDVNKELSAEAERIQEEVSLPKKMPPFDSIIDKKIGPAFFKEIDEDTVELKVNKETGQPLTGDFVDAGLVEAIEVTRDEYNHIKTPKDLGYLISEKLEKITEPKAKEISDEEVYAEAGITKEQAQFEKGGGVKAQEAYFRIKDRKAEAKDLVESKTREEIQNKLQKIFGTYEELDNLDKTDYMNRKLQIANEYMADLERSAVDRELDETEELLKRAKQELARNLEEEASFSDELQKEIVALHRKAVIDSNMGIPAPKLRKNETSFDVAVKEANRKFKREVYTSYKKMFGEYPIGFISLEDNSFIWRDEDKGSVVYNIRQAETDESESQVSETLGDILNELNLLESRGKSSEIIQSDIQYEIDRTRPEETKPKAQPVTKKQDKKLTSAEMRDRYDELNEKIDHIKAGKERNKLFKELDDLSDKLDAFNDRNKENVFSVMDKDKEIARIDVVKYSDGKYASRVSISLKTGGLSTPFDGVFNTKAEAISVRKDSIKRHIEETTLKYSPSAKDKTLAKKILEEMGTGDIFAKKPVTKPKVTTETKISKELEPLFFNDKTTDDQLLNRKEIIEITLENFDNENLEQELDKINVELEKRGILDEETGELIEKSEEPEIEAPVEEVEKSEVPDITGLTKPQIRKKIRDERLEIPDEGGKLLNKIAMPTEGIEMDIFGMKPELLYGGYEYGIFTDTYILLEGKEATELNKEIWDKENQKRAKRLKKDNPDLDIENTIKKWDEVNIKSSKEYKKGFPIKQVKEILSEKIGKEATIKGHFHSAPHIATVLSDGKTDVVVNTDKLAFMNKQLPNAKIMVTSEVTPVQFVENGKTKGLLMPMKTEIPRKSFFGGNYIITTNGKKIYQAYKPQDPGKAITYEESVAKVREYFTEKEVQVKLEEDFIITPAGIKAMADSYDTMIRFVKYATRENIPEHEVMHSYIRLFTTKAQRLDVMKEMKKKYPDHDLTELAEQLSDDFVAWRNKTKTFTGKIKKFFEDLFRKLQEFFGKSTKSEIEKLFEDVVAKRRRPDAEPLRGPPQFFKQQEEVDKYDNSKDFVEKSLKVYHSVRVDDLKKIEKADSKIISPSIGVAKNIEEPLEYGDVILIPSEKVLNETPFYTRDIWSPTLGFIPNKDKMYVANKGEIYNELKPIMERSGFDIDEILSESIKTENPIDRIRMYLTNDQDIINALPEIAEKYNLKLTRKEIEENAYEERIASELITKLKNTPEDMARYLREAYEGREKGAGSIFAGAQMSAEKFNFEELAKFSKRLSEKKLDSDKFFSDQLKATELLNKTLNRGRGGEIEDRGAGELAAEKTFEEFKKSLREDFGEDLSKITESKLKKAYSELRKAYVDIPSEYFEGKSFEAYDINDFPSIVTDNKTAKLYLKRMGYTGTIYDSYADMYNKMSRDFLTDQFDVARGFARKFIELGITKTQFVNGIKKSFPQISEEVMEDIADNARIFKEEDGVSNEDKISNIVSYIQASILDQELTNVQQFFQEPLSDDEIEAFDLIQAKQPIPKRLSEAIDSLKEKEIIREEFSPNLLDEEITEREIFEKEAEKERKAVGQKLFSDIKDNGGLKTDPTLIEEMSDLPIDILRTDGLIPDEMLETLNERGYNFQSISDMFESIRNVKSMPKRFRTARSETIRPVKPKAEKKIYERSKAPRELLKQGERISQRGITISRSELVKKRPYYVSFKTGDKRVVRTFDKYEDAKRRFDSMVQIRAKGFLKRGELPKELQPTMQQKGQAHMLAQKKKITPIQYKRLAKLYTEVDSMTKMTPEQAKIFIEALEAIKPTFGKTISIPITKEAVDLEMAERKFTNIRAGWLLNIFRSPANVFKRIGVGKETTELLKAFDRRRDFTEKWLAQFKGWQKQLGIRRGIFFNKKKMAEQTKRLFRALNNPNEEIILTEDEALVVTKARMAAEQVANLVDDARAEMGLDPMNRRKNYITNILTEEAHFLIKNSKQAPNELYVLLEDKLPSSVFDRLLLERKGGLPIKEDFWKAMKAMVEIHGKYIHINPPIHRFERFMRFYGDKIPYLSRKYLKSRINRFLGRPTLIDRYLRTLDEAISDGIGKIPGLSKKVSVDWNDGITEVIEVPRLLLKPSQKAFRTLKSVRYIYDLAFSVSFYTLNLTQFWLNTVPKLRGNAFEIYQSAFSAYAKMMVDFFRPSQWEYWRKRGVLTEVDNIIDKEYGRLTGGAEILNLFAKLSEFNNRVASALATEKNLALLQKKGKFEKLYKELNSAFGEEAQEYAKHIANISQFRYGVEEKPIFFDNPIADLWYQYNTFALKQIEFTEDMVAKLEAKGLLTQINIAIKDGKTKEFIANLSQGDRGEIIRFIMNAFILSMILGSGYVWDAVFKGVIPSQVTGLWDILKGLLTGNKKLRQKGYKEVLMPPSFQLIENISDYGIEATVKNAKVVKQFDLIYIAVTGEGELKTMDGKPKEKITGEVALGRLFKSSREKTALVNRNGWEAYIELETMYEDVREKAIDLIKDGKKEVAKDLAREYNEKAKEEIKKLLDLGVTDITLKERIDQSKKSKIVSSEDFSNWIKSSKK